MEIRTTSKLITFRNPLTLSALDKVWPIRTYQLRTEEQPLNTFYFLGWRQTGCLLGLFHYGAMIQDGNQGTGRPAAPSFRQQTLRILCGKENARDRHRTH